MSITVAFDLPLKGIFLRFFHHCIIRLDGLGSSLKKENINIRFSDNDRIFLKKETDFPLLKLGVYKLSIYSLYIHQPSTENSEAVANKLQTEQAETFQG